MAQWLYPSFSRFIKWRKKQVYYNINRIYSISIWLRFIIFFIHYSLFICYLNFYKVLYIAPFNKFSMVKVWSQCEQNFSSCWPSVGWHPVQNRVNKIKNDTIWTFFFNFIFQNQLFAKVHNNHDELQDEVIIVQCVQHSTGWSTACTGRLT